MKSPKLYGLLIGLVLTGCGVQPSASETSSILPTETEETVVFNLDVQREHGGINPDAFSIRFSADAHVGSNHCLAQGNVAHFVQKVRDNVLYVQAQVESTPNDLTCPDILQPVSDPVTVVVRGFRSDVDKIVVENVDEFENAVSFEL